MKKKSVMLTMLLCTAMLATSCGNNGNSGTTSVKQENQKEESKKESDTGKEKSEVVIGFSREGDSFSRPLYRFWLYRLTLRAFYFNKSKW